MSSSRSSYGLTIKSIKSTCYFTNTFLECEFSKEEVFILYYTENNKVFTFITDGNKWIEAPLTLRLILGEEVSQNDFSKVIEQIIFRNDT